MEGVIILVVLLGLWGVAIAALVSAARLPADAWHAARRSRGGTILGVLLSGGLGGIYYFASIRGPVRGYIERLPAPPREPRGSHRRYRKGDDPWMEDRAQQT